MYVTRWTAASFALAILVAPAWGGPTGATALPADPDLRAGLVVHLDCGNGAFTLDLAAQPWAKVVQGLTRSKEALEKARQLIGGKGWYGRVSVELLTPGRLPYANDSVNTLVVQDWPGLEKSGVSLSELMRVVAPFGSAWIEGADAKSLQGQLEAAGVKGLTVSVSGNWVKVSKPFPSDMDNWPQRGHDAGCSQLSRDGRVGPVRSVRWVAGHPWGGGTPGVHNMVVDNGRVFYVHTEEPIVFLPPEDRVVGKTMTCAQLIAYDAFSGVELWRRRVPASRGLIADGEVLYTTGVQRALVALDAATGKTIRVLDKVSLTVDRTQGGSDMWMLRYVDGVFLVPINNGDAFMPARKEDAFYGAAGHVVAWDAKTQEQLWEHVGPTYGRAGAGLPHPNAERASGELRPDFLVLEKNVYVLSADASKMLCRDLHTGTVRWETPLKSASERLLFAEAGLVFTQEKPGKLVDPIAGVTFRWEKHSEQRVLRAWKAATGEFLWEYNYLGSAWRNCGVYGGDVWLQVDRKDATFVALDAATGKEKKAVVAEGFKWGVNECTPLAATRDWMITACGYGFFNPLTGATELNPGAARGSCGLGTIPANGLMYQGRNFCRCYRGVRGLVAWSSDAPPPPPPGAAATQPAQRLEQGPAFGEAISAAAAAADDWPIYRHDPARTGGTTSPTSAKLKMLWTAALSGRPTQPVVAGGKVFCALPDQHLVCALDGKTGALLWQYRAGARVDSSPTWFAGRVFFGACDGWVYCLAAEDGRLIWRFLAAPEERRIMVREQLESPWPVHGSLLVDQNAVYAVAGRHTQADGGLWFYALDPASGKAIWSLPVGKQPSALAFSSDLMTRDGDKLCLLNIVGSLADSTGIAEQIDPQTGRLEQHGGGSQTPFAGAGGSLIWSGLLGFLRPHLYRDGEETLALRRHWYVNAKTPASTYGKLEADLLCTDGPRSWGFLYRPRTSMMSFSEGTNAKDLTAGNWVFSGDTASPWKQQVQPSSVWMKALVRAGDKVVLGSQPDDKSNTGQLTVYDAESGQVLGDVETPGTPCFDGLSAAGGQLYLACENAKIAKFGRADGQGE